MKLLLVLLLAISASAATISTISACNYNGPGPGSVSCSSGLTHDVLGDHLTSVNASVQGDTISLQAFTIRASTSAGATITHDDIFAVDSGLSQVFGVFRLNCSYPDHAGALASYSIGSGPLTVCDHDGLTILAPFAVSNGQARIMTFLKAGVSSSDFTSSVITTLSLSGFQDSGGMSIAATVVPEPATWGLLGVGVMLIAGVRSAKANREFGSS